MYGLRSPSILGVLAVAIVLVNLLDGYTAQSLPINLALNPAKVVSSSLSTNPGVDLKNVADGNINTMFHSAYPGFVAYGPANDFTPYVGIKLSQLSYITRIVIYNRPDCCADRLQNAELRIGFNEIISNNSVATNPLVWKQKAPPGSVIEVNLNAPVLGNWVSLQNFNPLPNLNWILNIMDIQVFGVERLLPSSLVPEVAYFDAMKNVITSPGSNAVLAWSDVDMQARKVNQLSFSSGCQLAQLDLGNAITFSGSCIGKMDNLSSSWSTDADSEFTAVWIGRYNSATAEQMLMTMSRTPNNDYDKELYWSTNASFLYTTAGGFALKQQISLAPTGQWTMEVFSRQQGATRGFHARYSNGSADRVSINSFVSHPSIVLGDNFAVGGDPGDMNKYLDGQVAVLLLYNRSLTVMELTSLATFYAPRFGWPKPSISAVCPSGQVYNAATGTCNPCERGSVVYIDGLICTPCPLGLWPDGTGRTCTAAADGNSELVGFDVSASPANYFEFSTDDSGSRAHDDLRVFRPKQGYWFGHTGIEVADYQNILLPNGTSPALIITSTKPLESLASPPLKPPTGWLRKWGFSKGFGIWCPMPPVGYVALGCVFRRSDTTGPQPSEVERLMTLRADLAVAAGGVTKIWFDVGTGASLNGTLWLPTADSSSGFPSGAMVGSSKYDATSALAELAAARMNWVLSSSKVFRTTAPPEGCPAGSAFSMSTRSCMTCPTGQVSPGFFGPCVTCASGTQPNVDGSACESIDTFPLVGRFELLAKSSSPIELIAFDVSSNPGPYFQMMDNDKGSGAYNHVSFFKPTEGLWFGQTAAAVAKTTLIEDPYGSDAAFVLDYINLSPGTPAYLFAATNLGRSNPPVKPPADWRRVWGTRKCGLFDSPGVRMGLYCPIPPTGYVALGCVFRSTPCTADYPGDTMKPPLESVDGLVTVRQDLAIPARNIERVWNDRGSGASLNTAVWRLATSDSDSFASGAMVGSSTYDYSAALQELLQQGLMWTLNSNKVPVLKGPPGANNPGPVDCENIDRAVTRFAPILKLDSLEQFFPSSMDDYLAQSAIGSSIPGTVPDFYTVKQKNCPGFSYDPFYDNTFAEVCRNNTISPANTDCATCMKANFGVDVNSPTTSTLRDFDVKACPSCPPSDNTFLNPRPGADMSYIYGTRPQPALGKNPPIYTTVVDRNRGGIVDIFYQTFYAYNGGKRLPPIISASPECLKSEAMNRYGDHFGDFEVAVVRLVFYQGVPFIWQLGGSRHGHIYPYRPVGRITYAQGAHPVLYVLSGGHGIQSYPGKSPSDNWILARAGMEEYFDGSGANWETYKNIETYYSTRSDCPAQGEMSKWWKSYTARFGRSQYGTCIWGESMVNDGPTAPNTKDSRKNYGDSTYTFPTSF